MEKAERESFKWTNEDVDKLLAAIQNNLVGNPADNGFSKETWTKILKDFNERSQLTLKKEQLQSKLHSLKEKYFIFKDMKNQSGWGWDDVRQIPDIDERVWNDYVSSHPKAHIFYNPVSKTFSTCPWFHELNAIYSNNTATGTSVRLEGQKRQPPAKPVDDEELIENVEKEFEVTSNPFRSTPVAPVILPTQNTSRSESSRNSSSRSSSSSEIPLPAPKKHKNGINALASAILEYVKMTTAIQLTPSQTAFKRIDDLCAKVPFFQNLSVLQRLRLKSHLSNPTVGDFFSHLKEDEACMYVEEWLQEANLQNSSNELA
jgi:hypothetical protein